MLSLACLPLFDYFLLALDVLKSPPPLLPTRHAHALWRARPPPLLTLHIPVHLAAPISPAESDGTTFAIQPTEPDRRAGSQRTARKAIGGCLEDCLRAEVSGLDQTQAVQTVRRVKGKQLPQPSGDGKERRSAIRRQIKRFAGQ
eukprot:6213260-Pleurochrysis_carterae.AAC.1